MGASPAALAAVPAAADAPEYAYGFDYELAKCWRVRRERHIGERGEHSSELIAGGTEQDDSMDIQWPGKERRDLRMEPVCGACVWSPRVENESMIVMLGL